MLLPATIMSFITTTTAVVIVGRALSTRPTKTAGVHSRPSNQTLSSPAIVFRFKLATAVAVGFRKQHVMAANMWHGEPSVPEPSDSNDMEEEEVAAKELEVLEDEAIAGKDKGREPEDYARRAQVFDESSRVFRALKEKEEGGAGAPPPT